MRSVLELQKAINRLYGKEKGSYRLSQEERDKIDFTVKVDEGSSLVNIDLGSAVEVLQSMGGTEIIIGIGLVVSGIMGVRWIAERYKTKREEIKLQSDKVDSEERKEVIRNALATVDRTVEEINKAYRNLTYSGADELVINAEKTTPNELLQLVKTDRRQKEVASKVLEGQFKINALDFQ